MKKCNLRTWLTNFNNQKYDSESYGTLKAAGWTFWSGKTEKVHVHTTTVGELLNKISDDMILDNFCVSMENRIVEKVPATIVRFMKMPSEDCPYFSDIPLAMIKIFEEGQYAVVDCNKVFDNLVCESAEDAITVLLKILTPNA